MCLIARVDLNQAFWAGVSKFLEFPDSGPPIVLCAYKWLKFRPKFQPEGECLPFLTTPFEGCPVKLYNYNHTTTTPSRGLTSLAQTILKAPPDRIYLDAGGFHLYTIRKGKQFPTFYKLPTYEELIERNQTYLYAPAWFYLEDLIAFEQTFSSSSIMVNNYALFTPDNLPLFNPKMDNHYSAEWFIKTCLKLGQQGGPNSVAPTPPPHPPTVHS